MKRFLWLFFVPYVVTVTDLGKQCIDYEPVVIPSGSIVSDCKKYVYDKRYHLPGFQDCVSSSTAQCSYLQEIAADLNRAHEKGYEPPIMKNDCMYPNLCGSTTDANFDPDLQPAHPTKIICHKLVGGMMESVPCGPDAEIDRLNKQNKDLKDIVDQFGRGAR